MKPSCHQMRPRTTASAGVRQPDAVALARPLAARPEARADHQRPQRPDAEHDQRVAEEAVAEALLPGSVDVLLEGQRGDVAVAAAIEVPGGPVVHRVGVAPGPERLEDEECGQTAQPEIPLPRREERAVAAVVEDDEGPQQAAGRRNREGERQPDRDVEGRGTSPPPAGGRARPTSPGRASPGGPTPAHTARSSLSRLRAGRAPGAAETLWRRWLLLPAGGGSQAEMAPEWNAAGWVAGSHEP